MTIDEAKSKLEQWYDDGCVGNIWFFRAPRTAHVEGFIERTIKVFEMSKDEARSVNRAFDEFGGIRTEIYSGKDGAADRIKVVKTL